MQHPDTCECRIRQKIDGYSLCPEHRKYIYNELGQYNYWSGLNFNTDRPSRQLLEQSSSLTFKCTFKLLGLNLADFYVITVGFRACHILLSYKSRSTVYRPHLRLEIVVRPQPYDACLIDCIGFVDLPQCP